MTEFELIDGTLVMECEHEWGSWRTLYGDMRKQCLRCRVERVLVTKPDKLPERSSFSLFLADFKARFNK